MSAPASPDDGERREIAYTRVSLACAAYPELVEKARDFRVFARHLNGLLLSLLLGTCLVSWFVAFGNEALSQHRNAEIGLVKAIAAADALTDATKDPPPATGAQGEASVVVQPAATPTPMAESERTCIPTAAACHARSYAEPASGDLAAFPAFCDVAERAFTTRTRPQAAACHAAFVAREGVKNADAGIARWLKFWPGEWPPGQTTDFYATSVANNLGTVILPFLYGVLGAGAAAMLAVSRRTRLSLLSPRDRGLIRQQLTLGAITGACIGIFIAGESGSANGVIGPVGLSASGLSFLAGFGADAVFTTLETAIKRVFNIGQPPPPKA